MKYTIGQKIKILQKTYGEKNTSERMKAYAEYPYAYFLKDKGHYCVIAANKEELKNKTGDYYALSDIEPVEETKSAKSKPHHYTDEELVYIYTSKESIRDIARTINVTKSAIFAVRNSLKDYIVNNKPVAINANMAHKKAIATIKSQIEANENTKNVFKENMLEEINKIKNREKSDEPLTKLTSLLEELPQIIQEVIISEVKTKINNFEEKDNRIVYLEEQCTKFIDEIGELRKKNKNLQNIINESKAINFITTLKKDLEEI